MPASNKPRNTSRAPHIKFLRDSLISPSRAITGKCTESWLKDNKEAIERSNEFGERYGPPLQKYRMF